MDSWRDRSRFGRGDAQSSSNRLCSRLREVLKSCLTMSMISTFDNQSGNRPAGTCSKLTLGTKEEESCRPFLTYHMVMQPSYQNISTNRSAVELLLNDPSVHAGEENSPLTCDLEITTLYRVRISKH